jgi:hypothetical protein
MAASRVRPGHLDALAVAAENASLAAANPRSWAGLSLVARASVEVDRYQTSFV